MLIYYKHNQWQLNTHKVIYREVEEVTLNIFIHDISWWEEFTRTWDYIEVDLIEELQFTDEQLQRYEHVKYLPEDFGHIYSHYVETGEVLESSKKIPSTHPFHLIVLKNKEIIELNDKVNRLENLIESLLN